MDQAAAAGKLVFTFPGQGSYHSRILEELFERYPYAAQFEAANQTTRRILGREFLPLVQANPANREQALQACPDLDQVAIYVTDVLIADLLLKAGIRPDLLLGHSFGELAALAAGGAYSFGTGLKMVCQRCLALRPLRAAGRMAAVSCGPDQAALLIQTSGGKTLQIGVVNHDRQTVISGDAAELSRLGEVAALRGVGHTILRSRYPFHSALLAPAVETFRTALCSYEFQPPTTPVYLGTEDKFYGAECDLAEILSGQLTRKLDFSAIVRRLYESGYSRFVECGAGDVLTGITSKALTGKAGLICRASAHQDTGVAAGSAAILKEFERGLPGQAVDSVPALLQDVEAVLKRTSQILGKAAVVVPSLQPVVKAEPQPEAVAQEPIAIVAMGCVLPGARNVGEYWDHIL